MVSVDITADISTETCGYFSFYIIVTRPAIDRATYCATFTKASRFSYLWFSLRVSFHLISVISLENPCGGSVRDILKGTYTLSTFFYPFLCSNSWKPTLLYTFLQPDVIQKKTMKNQPVNRLPARRKKELGKPGKPSGTENRPILSSPDRAWLALLALDHTRLARPETQSGTCSQANGEWTITKQFNHG